MLLVRGYSRNSKQRKRGQRPRPYWKRKKMLSWAKSRAGQRWAGFSV